MTVIVYHQNKLGADQRGISDMGTHTEAHYTMKKIFTYFKDGKPVMAMAKTGAPFPPALVDNVIRTMYLQCQIIESRNDTTKLDILEAVKDIFGDELTGVLVITRRALYRFTENLFYQSSDSGPRFLGSGGNIARTAIFGFNASIEEAIQKAIQLDICCGGEPVVVSQKSLSPIKKIKIPNPFDEVLERKPS